MDCYPRRTTNKPPSFRLPVARAIHGTHFTNYRHYLFLLVLFRLPGKRLLEEISAFDFILFLISEAILNALIVSILKRKYVSFERLTEGAPLLLVEHGKYIEENMKKGHVMHADIHQTAREGQGLERIDHIIYAVL